jgi:hypothetical protein
LSRALRFERSSEQPDLLPTAIQLFYFVAPLEILMVYAGTTELTAGMVGGAALGTAGVVLLLSSGLTVSWQLDRPLVYMLLFLLAGTVSTALTVYGPPAIQRGLTNIFAMTALAVMALVVRQAASQLPWLLPHLVRIMSTMAGFAGLTVLYQSFVSNVLGIPELFDLSAVNTFWNEGWWRFGGGSGIVRAQGIYAEPSFLAAYLGMASGVALTRLGFFGSRWRHLLHNLVPGWAAITIIVALILSLSTVVYAGLFVAYLGGWSSKTRFTARSIAAFLTAATCALAGLTFVAMQNTDILERLTSLAVFNQLDAIDADTNANGQIDVSAQLTVQILFVNAYVALQNILVNPIFGAGVGAHPYSHDTFVAGLPLLMGMAPEAIRLNTMDAGALLLRLLSETGILGTALFTAAVSSAWLRTRLVVIACHGYANARQESVGAIALGLNSGLVAVYVAMLLHIPHYYTAPFWGLFALCVAIPILRSETGCVPNSQKAQ